MHYSRLHVGDCPIDKPRDLSLFPAFIRRRIGRPAAALAAVMLLSLTSADVCFAQVGPLAVEQSKPEPAVGLFADFVAEAARRFGLPILWINAVMGQESGDDVLAISGKGAMGLMQIMPDTWEELRSRHGLGLDPFDPRDNILAGAAYLREMYDRYGSPGFLAAYNAGPKRYEEYLTIARELPLETQLYVANLVPVIGARTIGGMVAMASRETPWQESTLFAARGSRSSSAGLVSSPSPSDRASVGSSVGGRFTLRPQANGLFVGRATAGPSQ